MTKVCNKCKQEFPLSQFYFRAGTEGLRYAQCIACKAKSHAQWERQHRGRRNYLRSTRRYGHSMPRWADQTLIEKMYKHCPSGYEVDHVVPIAGIGVCGLHVHYNLQHLTKKQNTEKGNSYEQSY